MRLIQFKGISVKYYGEIVIILTLVNSSNLDNLS